MTTEMVAIRMGIQVEHLDHMVGVMVGAAEAVGVGVAEVAEAMTGRIRTMDHRSGVLRMVMMVADGVVFLEQKFRIHQAGKLSLVAGGLEVVVEAEAVTGATLVAAGGREAAAAVQMMLMMQVVVNPDGVAAKRVPDNHNLVMMDGPVAAAGER